MSFAVTRVTPAKFSPEKANELLAISVGPRTERKSQSTISHERNWIARVQSDIPRNLIRHQPATPTPTSLARNASGHRQAP